MGSVANSNTINKAIFKHFLLLHYGISIPVSNKNIKKFGLEFANKFLKTFVEPSKNIYGKIFLIYNGHILNYLTENVQNFGPLDAYVI